MEAGKTRLPNLNLPYTTKQASRVSCVAQTGSAAFAKRVQLPFAEIEQLSQLTYLSGKLSTS